MQATAGYLGTDVGGTFTDLVFCTASGQLHCYKVPSTPARPGKSILDGVDEIAAGLGGESIAWGDVHHTHSSTVATNALIERRGARLGLLTTRGFRDLFELQRLAVPNAMRFDSVRPQPLIPRALTREIGGRIGSDGKEIEPLDPAEAEDAARALAALGVEIAVVVLLHSYRNPAHEQAVRAVVQRSGLGLRTELSSEVWPQAREYERGVLAGINASIRPVMEAYVDLLETGLSARGVIRPARVARSNGGAELADTMRHRPVVALLSGPAAGVSGAAAVAQDAGWEAADLMTIDVGGTSADIGVIRAGRPVLSTEEHIADFPLLVPTIAVSSIGAGGGSIIWLDQTGALRVGPRSVGADPGPACYALSGSLVPALTDAFLVAGLLAPGQQLGGKLALHMEPARAALAGIATRIGWSVEEVADGAIRVATALMAAEATSVLARRGVDAPRFRMVAFGGAGPLVAALVADEIAIDSILIPPRPGALSALGAARADLEGDLVQPIYAMLRTVPRPVLAEAQVGLTERASAWLAEQGRALPVTATAIEMAADMRYDGQGYDVTVPLQAEWLRDGDVPRIQAAFEAVHKETYGHVNERADVWLKELRAHVIGRMPKAALVAEPDRAAGAGDRTERSLRLFGQVFTARVHERAALDPAREIAGPAIINQMDTTTLVPEGWKMREARSGSLIVERSA